VPIIAGASFPFLAIIAYAVMFDSSGGEPFSFTVFAGILLMPLWLSIGIGAGFACRASRTVKTIVWAVDAVLLGLIVTMVLVIRYRNSVRRLRTVCPTQADGVLDSGTKSLGMPGWRHGADGQGPPAAHAHVDGKEQERANGPHRVEEMGEGLPARKLYGISQAG
jgi:hypothetical protein